MIVEVTPEEFKQIQAQELNLPPGWLTFRKSAGTGTRR
jgi:hypothetical protein